jgi:hypothetical protein
LKILGRAAREMLAGSETGCLSFRMDPFRVRFGRRSYFGRV